MTLLQIMSATDRDDVRLRTTDLERIAAELAPHSVRLDHRPLRHVPDDAGPDDILRTYQDVVDEVRADGGYRLVDVVALAPAPADPDWPQKARAARERFLDEHTHDEDEVRFFTSGTGCFYLRFDDLVYAVVCEAGDLMSVPAGTTHWFDMGATPDFAAVRFFHDEDGWVAAFTGDGISSRMPTLDDLVAVPA